MTDQARKVMVDDQFPDDNARVAYENWLDQLNLMEYWRKEAIDAQAKIAKEEANLIRLEQEAVFSAAKAAKVTMDQVLLKGKK